MNDVKVKIQYPDYKEQEKIVQKLDLVNNILEKRKKEIEFLDNLIKARFVEMFGDPIKKPKEYSVHRLSDNMQPVNAPDNAEAKRTKVQEGDLLISITADLGRTGVVTKEIAEHGAYIN